MIRAEGRTQLATLAYSIRRPPRSTLRANIPRRSAREHHTRSVSVATALALLGGRAHTVRMLCRRSASFMTMATGCGGKETDLECQPEVLKINYRRKVCVRSRLRSDTSSTNITVKFEAFGMKWSTVGCTSSTSISRYTEAEGRPGAAQGYHLIMMGPWDSGWYLVHHRQDHVP